MTDDNASDKIVPHPVAKSERTITWPIKGFGTVRLSKGVYECVLPDGAVVETFRTLNFAIEFLQERERPIRPEQQARRLKDDINALSRQSPTERAFALPDYAKRHGRDETELHQLIAAEIEVRLEQQRQEQEAERRREEREDREARKTEQKQAREAKDKERERKADERARREAERIEREQEAKRKRREAVFVEIAELPKLTHEVRLKEAAKRLGEDFEVLVEEFEVFYAAREIPEDLEPWPEPVDTAELLAEIEAKFRRYIVASDAIITASVLWAVFTYVVEVATHAPKLVFTFPVRDAGKSVAQDVLFWIVLRPYAAVEATGAAVYRIIDRWRPTLCLDEADSLFKRRTMLAHIVNASWANNKRKVPRAGSRGKSIDEFDVYGAQLISMRGLNMPDTTQSRSIICLIWPKLASEKVEEFTYQDDDEFKAIRRKLLRFAIDNAVILRDAKPDFPPGFNNRIRTNWKMLLAIADIAGGERPERVRKAALELEADRDEPDEVIRLFQGLKDIWGSAEERSSKSICKALAAHPSGEWADFRGKGPIGPHQLAALLRPFGIRPIHNLHPTGRADKNVGGYRRAQFENAWARLLQKPSRDSLTRSPSRRSPKRGK
jgi:putative DNA primase/helicase